jgi:hypothetical protein
MQFVMADGSTTVAASWETGASRYLLKLFAFSHAEFADVFKGFLPDKIKLTVNSCSACIFFVMTHALETETETACSKNVQFAQTIC